MRSRPASKASTSRPKARSPRRFKHPRIVKTYSHGITTNDEQFVVMEFLDGPGLNSLIIGRSKLLDGNRLTLARQAAEALEAVHDAGLHPPRHLPAELRLLRRTRRRSS